MKRYSKKALAVVVAAGAVMCTMEVHAAAGVFVNRNDDARTGANLTETHLHTRNVNPRQFGKLFTYPVDGQIYAQPLYAQNMKLPDGRTRNVVFVATMENTVYAFDADGGGLIWRRDLKSPAKGLTPVPIADIVNPNLGDIDPTTNVGIEGTPVIDPGTWTMYFVARSKESGRYVQRLHALDVKTGASRIGSGNEITATYKGVVFDPKVHMQRPGLTLAKGQVIVCWGSHQDFNQYHGWIMSFDKFTVKPTGAFATSVTTLGSAIWSAGRAPAVLPGGDIVVFTSNGFGPAGTSAYDGVQNWSETVLRLDPARNLAIVDWFTPSNWNALDLSDRDLGGSGPTLIPGSSTIIGGGKEGVMYVVNGAAMGKMQAGNPKLMQSFPIIQNAIIGGPTLWDRRSAGLPLLMYHWGANDTLNAYTWLGTKFNTIPVARSAVTINGFPGGIVSVSANGATSGSGIVWVTASDSGGAGHNIRHGVLRAFDAENVGRELWNSNMVVQDDLGTFAKFTPPTIFNTKVFVPTFSKQLVVYGQLPKPR